MVVDDPPLNLPGFFDGLGECRRTSPNACVTIRAFTEMQEVKHNKALNTHAAELSKALEEWNKRWENELRTMEVRLENIKESLSTCQGSSAAHWKSELVKQENKIEKRRREHLDFDFVDFWLSQHPEPDELKTFEAFKGVWPLTGSDEFCGEWQQR